MAFKFSKTRGWLLLIILLWSCSLNAQTVSGIVTSEKGEALGSVVIEITISGSSEKQMSTTDEKGQFTTPALKANNKYQFNFTHVGFEPYIVSGFKVKTGDKNLLIVRMKEAASNMNEVVVVGYGSVRRKDVTGAISTIKSDKITQIAVTNVTQAMQGRVAGVMVQTDSWKPGAVAQVRVRGNRSITASNEALYVVDGIPLSDGSISDINPNDIESISVLKDASATAIYGNRGANGVILITTKRGEKGRTVVEYSGYYGVQENKPLPSLMNAAEFVEYSREAQRNSLGGAYDPKPSKDLDFKNDQLVATPYMAKNMEAAWEGGSYDPSKLKSTDWISYGLRNGNIQDHQVSVRGGNDLTKVLFSADYFNNVGVVRDQDYKRYSIRVNVDHSITKRVKVGTQMLYANSQQDAGWDDVFDGYGLKSFNPLASPYEEDGVTLALFPTNNTRTPNPITNFGKTKRLNKQDRYLGNYYAEVALPANFSFKTSLGIDYRAAQALNFNSANTAAAGGIAPSATSNSGSKKFMYTWENVLNYNKSINNEHNFGVTLLQSIQSQTTENYGIVVSDLPYDQQLYYNVGTALTINSISSRYQKWGLASFMGRMNYSYKDKYLATVSARYDGASVLAEGHKWALFPSLALAWRLKSEDFLKAVPFISDLKLRVGYGRTGNSTLEQPYRTWGSLTTVRYDFGGTSTLGFTPKDMINPSLSWETTGQYNAGIDFGIFKGRVTGSIEVYKQNTYDLLLNQNLPTASGFNQILVNIGKTSNKGLEVTLNTAIVASRTFKWNADIMFATNKQQILELYNGTQDDLSSGWFIGRPKDVYYDVSPNGIWQNTDADKAEMAKFAVNGATFKPGDIRPLDYNNDYRIDAADRHILGQKDPKWTASLGNTFQYNNFDASIFMYANVGHIVYHDLDMRFDGRYNQPKLDYWTPENPSNKYPRPLLGTAGLNYLGILNYYSGSFMRVKNISLGYNMPLSILKPASIERFRIYASVQNPFIVTNFPGTDPEGATGFNEPSVRTYMIGVNVSF
ncbi:TonB-linked outer membrane protein, SusC/RagA family [Niastella yeongjuensis]|nr:TonB-linked outer membrane protein, SusC/RagA family [Niastella yeongjuensis]